MFLQIVTPLIAFTFIGNAAIAREPVEVALESSLSSDGDHIRQLAFDGDPESYFASKGPAKPEDHFTMTFDEPIVVRSIRIRSGRPNGKDALEAAEIAISADGKTFEPVGAIESDSAEVKLPDAGRRAKSIRIRPNRELDHPIAIREIGIQGDADLAVFKYPVEFELDLADAPELKDWTESAARVCERQYAMINTELEEEGFHPPRRIRLRMRKMEGVANAGGGRITAAVAYFKRRPDDVGALVHETVHIVQSYRGRGAPGWLVEGIADYIRFFKYEPDKIGPINAEKAHYNSGYRTSAAFLNYAATKYDKELINKLNKLLRNGMYNPNVFKEFTGKTLEELDAEWRESLRAKDPG